MTYVNEHVNEDDMEFCIMHWFDNSEGQKFENVENEEN